jgi:phenylacetate-CoA ligase
MSRMSYLSTTPRRALYLHLHSLAGIPVSRYYNDLVAEDPYSNPTASLRTRLNRLLTHCERSVPYYSALLSDSKGSYHHEPEKFLRELPILTKQSLRHDFQRLISTDIARRRWRYNTSGGSTGEPVKFIQDSHFSAYTTATMILNAEWLGCQLGEPAIWLWGSEREVLESSRGFKVRMLNWLSGYEWLNAFQMTPERMHDFLEAFSRRRPELIVAYAQSIYELARFAERENLTITQQQVIMTSAGTLYDFMRESIERCFGCEVFDKYGSREVGNIAWECDQHRGLHTFPWSTYIEIVDDDGLPVANGVEGNVLTTCLTNFAMPLIRYAIGDRAVLSPAEECGCGRKGQVLEKIVGRSVDTFKAKDGTLIDGEYFTHLLYFREWVHKFQVIQRDYSHVIFRIVAGSPGAPQAELDEITHGVRAALGENCHVEFDFASDIRTSSSGKYRYTISEIPNEALAAPENPAAPK